MRSSQKPWTVELAADHGIVGQVAACHNAVRPRSIRFNRHKTHPGPQQDRGTISIDLNSQLWRFRGKLWDLRAIFRVPIASLKYTNSWDGSRIVKNSRKIVRSWFTHCDVILDLYILDLDWQWINPESWIFQW